jgi:isopenicillin-N epimerase
VKVVELPFPVSSAAEIVERVVAAFTSFTRLVVIDHVTSQSGIILPLSSIVKEARHRGIETLVDGAHAPGMIPLDLRALGATYYAGNCHKWVCAPKGAAFLYVSAERRASIRPTVISHGANSPRADRSRYLLEFDWTGTADPTPYLCIPAALRFVKGLRNGGWSEVMAANRTLALRARDLLCAALNTGAPAPDDMIGSMASVPIPDGDAQALQTLLRERYMIEPLVLPFPEQPKRALRVSAQLYNSLQQYEALAGVLPNALYKGAL